MVRKQDMLNEESDHYFGSKGYSEVRLRVMNTAQKLVLGASFLWSLLRLHPTETSVILLVWLFRPMGLLLVWCPAWCKRTFL